MQKYAYSTRINYEHAGKPTSVSLNVHKYNSVNVKSSKIPLGGLQK
jgi:hypothetical protein